MLSVKNLEVFYGSIHAIKDISFEVNEGEIVTLIGANGAGKSTTLHAISNLVRPKAGKSAFWTTTFGPPKRRRSCASALPRFRKAGGSSPP